MKKRISLVAVCLLLVGILLTACGGNKWEGTWKATKAAYNGEEISGSDMPEITIELKKDGKTHIRIDYKMSGLGFNSCGPELDKEYRLDEKKIKFNFTIKPAVL